MVKFQVFSRFFSFNYLFIVTMRVAHSINLHCVYGNRVCLCSVHTQHIMLMANKYSFVSQTIAHIKYGQFFVFHDHMRTHTHWDIIVTLHCVIMTFKLQHFYHCYEEKKMLKNMGKYFEKMIIFGTNTRIYLLNTIKCE